MLNLGDRVKDTVSGLEGYVVALSGQPRGQGFDNPTDVVYEGKVGVRFDTPFSSDVSNRSSLYWLLSITRLEAKPSADKVEDWLE